MESSTNFTKIWRFLPNQKEFGVKLCYWQAHQNIGKNIGRNSHIGRYSKG